MRLRANHEAQYVDTGQRLKEFSGAERAHFVRVGKWGYLIVVFNPLKDLESA